MAAREVTGGTFRPNPGERAEDYQLPGPGSYEADFSVPDWLLPDWSAERQFSFSKDGHKITHLWSRVRGDVLTVRFDVEPMMGAVMPAEIETVPLLLGGIMAVVGAGILGYLGTVAFKALREVRLIVKTPIVAGGFGVLLLGAGLLLASKAVR